jgi:Phosphotransferase enzyme family
MPYTLPLMALFRSRTPDLLARAPRDLTLAWAEAVLGRHAAGVRVSRLETLDVDVGTTTRVRLAVEHDGPQRLPRKWFVKLPSGSWKARAITALPRLPQTEVRFYEELAREVPVSSPLALAAVRRLGRGYTLVLGDVTCDGAVPGRSGEAIDATQAGAMVEVLAKLHGHLREHPRLRGDLAWLGGPVRRLEDGLGTALAVPLMKRGLARAEGVVPESLRAAAVAYAGRRRAAMRVLGAAPTTLIHHDCHPGNLYWAPEGPGLLDWQLVRAGDGVGDVSYLFATALEPEVRRASEDELLERYADALAARGAPRPEPGWLRERYRLHMTYAFEAMVVTLAVGGLMDDAVALEMIRRTASAVEDHGSFQAMQRACGA